MEAPPSAMGLVLRAAEGRPGVEPSPPQPDEDAPDYQLEIDDPETQLAQQVEALEAFLRASSHTLAGHVDGLLRTWAAVSVDVTAELAAGRAKAACQVSRGTVVSLRTRVEDLRDELIGVLRSLDGTSLDGPGAPDPRLAKELLDALEGIEDSLFPTVSDALRQLEALDIGAVASPEGSTVPLPVPPQPDQALGYEELDAPPVFVHDADPKLTWLRGIPGRSLQARPRSQGLDAYLLDILEPSLALISQATGENLRAMMTDPRAELPHLLAMHSLSCACGRVADPEGRELAAAVKRCGQQLAAAQLELERAHQGLLATRPLLLRLTPGHGARALASHMARAQRSAVQKLKLIQAVIQAEAVCTHTSDPVDRAR